MNEVYLLGVLENKFSYAPRSIEDITKYQFYPDDESLFCLLKEE